MEAKHLSLKPVETTYIKKTDTRPRPEKDEQAMEALIRTLAVAIFTERETIITVWSEYEEQSFRGIITELDKVHRTIRIENNEEYSWIPLEDVLDMVIITDDLAPAFPDTNRVAGMRKESLFPF